MYSVCMDSIPAKRKKRENECEREREREKTEISSRVVLLNEIVESIFLTTRIFHRLQLSESSLLNNLVN